MDKVVKMAHWLLTFYGVSNIRTKRARYNVITLLQQGYSKRFTRMELFRYETGESGIYFPWIGDAVRDLMEVDTIMRGRYS